MPTKKERYRVALIGCGDIAETGHLPALTRHPRIELAAVCDISPARRALLAQQAGGVRAISDYRDLAADKSIDAVILALHPEVSVGVAIDFLRGGKAVLDEKPLARTIDDGLRLAREIKESGGIYQIGFVFRYCSLIEDLARHAQQIGTPALYCVKVYDEVLDRNNRAHVDRIQHALQHSSAITHEGSHVIDYFQLLNPSRFTRVYATALRTDGSFAGNNLWSAQLSCADGSVLSIEIGWLLPKLPPCEISITGPNGVLKADLRTGRGHLKHKDVNEAFESRPLQQDWNKQLAAFVNAMDSGATQHATIEDGLRALRATVACENSARTSQAVELS